MWVGMALLVRAMRRGTDPWWGLALVIANKPFLRLFTAAMGGGDEGVLWDLVDAQAGRWLATATVLALSLPPMIACWRVLAPHRRGWVFAGAFVLLMSALVVTRRVPPEYGKFFAWPGFVWLALLFYLVIALGIAEVPRRILLRRATLVPAAVGAEPVEIVPDPSRRLFISRSVAIGSGIAAGSVVGYGMTQALGAPQLLNVPVTLDKLQKSLSGFRIAVVSDIHLGPLLGRSHTERIVRMINEQEARLAHQRELFGRMLGSRAFAVAERLSRLRRGSTPVFSRDEVRRVLDEDAAGD